MAEAVGLQDTRTLKRALVEQRSQTKIVGRASSQGLSSAYDTTFHEPFTLRQTVHSIAGSTLPLLKLKPRRVPAVACRWRR
jgi:hypothetical protein